MKHAFPAFALFAFVLLGCGKDAPPAPPPTTAPAAPAAPREVVHELDAAKHDIPAQPVSGRIDGKPFTPDRVDLDGNVLTFRQGPAVSPDVQLMLMLSSNVPADGPFRTVVRAEQKTGEGIPSLFLSTKTGSDLKNGTVDEGYALTLELGKPEQGKVNGKVHLSLPGAAKSVIAGTFTALHDRSSTSPPGPGDKPYVTGAITHTGKKDETLHVGYARLPAAGQESFCDTIQTTIPPDDMAIGAVRATANKPRTVSIRPGAEGKGVDYDLTKLPPGKYLIAARMEGGVPVWSLQDVTPESALTVPLTLPTGAGGTVEVDVPGLPNDSVLQAQVIPVAANVDDPTGQYEAHAGLILGSWANLDKGKATIKQIPPGEYVVSARAGDVRYSAKVTVKAGETVKAELKMP